MRSLVLIAASLSILAGARTAQAVVIDFSGTFGFTSYVESGFEFASPSIDPGASGSFDVLTWDNSTIFPVVMTASSGNPFSLTSLDVGTDPGRLGVSSFDIVGFVQGGGSLLHNVVGVASFSTLVLNWTNLTSVEFAWVAGLPAIDNVDVSEVPEPGAALLLVVAGLTLWHRPRG